MRGESDERPCIFPEGHVIDKYKIVRRLGYGGIADVYEVEHTHLYVRLALKVLHPAHLHRPEARQAMKNMIDVEARIGAQLRRSYVRKHGADGLVQVVDGGATQDGLPYFVMDLLHGHTLYALIKHRKQTKVPVSVAQALHVGIKIATVLLLLHECNLIHCDLKPDNVFVVVPSGEIVLLDLGMVSQQGNPDRIVRARFTPRYAGPEQLLMQPARFSTDVYALGLLLYELITGQHPLERPGVVLTEHQYLHAHVHTPVRSMREHRPELSEALDIFICSLLRKELEPSDPRRPSLEQAFNTLRQLSQLESADEQLRAVRDLALDLPQSRPVATGSDRLVVGSVSPSMMTPAGPSSPLIRQGAMVPIRMPSAPSAPEGTSTSSTDAAAKAAEAKAVKAKVTLKGLSPGPRRSPEHTGDGAQPPGLRAVQLADRGSSSAGGARPSADRATASAFQVSALAERATVRGLPGPGETHVPSRVAPAPMSAPPPGASRRSANDNQPAHTRPFSEPTAPLQTDPRPASAGPFPSQSSSAPAIRHDTWIEPAPSIVVSTPAPALLAAIHAAWGEPVAPSPSTAPDAPSSRVRSVAENAPSIDGGPVVELRNAEREVTSAKPHDATTDPGPPIEVTASAARDGRDQQELSRPQPALPSNPAPGVGAVATLAGSREVLPARAPAPRAVSRPPLHGEMPAPAPTRARARPAPVDTMWVESPFDDPRVGGEAGVDARGLSVPRPAAGARPATSRDVVPGIPPRSPMVISGDSRQGRMRIVRRTAGARWAVGGVALVVLAFAVVASLLWWLRTKPTTYNESSWSVFVSALRLQEGSPPG